MAKNEKSNQTIHVTFVIDPALLKRIDHYRIDAEETRSDVIAEAVMEYLERHGDQSWQKWQSEKTRN